jgi:hypothetical protein
LPVKAIYAEINARRPASVDRNVARLVDSMTRRGYDPACPVVVSARPKGKYLVLRGHCRHGAATQVGIDAIPCVIYSGLTNAQERAIMADNTRDQAGLDWTDAESFDAIRGLVASGYASETALAVHFGWTTTDKAGALQPARNKMQLRVNAAKMYNRIAIFAAALENGLSDESDKTKPIVKWQDVQALRTADNADRTVGVLDGSGPAFREAWDKVQARYNGQSATLSKPLTVKAASETAQLCSSKILADALLVATKQGAEGMTLATLDAIAVECETARALLASLREFDSERFDSFVSDMESATAPETAVA